MEDKALSNSELLSSLESIADTLKELDDKNGAPRLSHYRVLPQDVSEAYELLQNGATLVHSTSTKFSLMGKISVKEQERQFCNIMLQGCQCIATSCLVLHDNQTGCARSTRKHCKQACRAVLNTVIQLVKIWNDGVSAESSSQRTGAVWEMCDAIIEQKVPKGNRNSIRRDLLTYSMDCNETMKEFQAMVDSSTSCEAGGDEYTATEASVVSSCIYLIRCSRGCINLSLQVMEVLGKRIDESKGDSSDEVDFAVASSSFFDLARLVGEGVTDLGVSLYPPLQADEVKSQIEHQTGHISSVLEFEHLTSIDLPEETQVLRSKLGEALLKRKREALSHVRHLDTMCS